MAHITERRLEIKSHSDEVLKQIDEYFEKYPKRPSIPANPSINKDVMDLQNEADYLKKLLGR